MVLVITIKRIRSSCKHVNNFIYQDSSTRNTPRNIHLHVADRPQQAPNQDDACTSRPLTFPVFFEAGYPSLNTFSILLRYS
jgi:hypothetical protein